MSIELTRLPSGLTIVTDSMPHFETASLGVWVGSGSRDEAPEENGISHFLEHMAFKGTTHRTARQIAEEIEAVGGDLNERQERISLLPNDQGAVEKFILAASRAAREGAAA